MSADVDALNSGLFRLHRVFYVAFFAFAVLMLVIGLMNFLRAGRDGEVGLAFSGVFLLPFGVAHWYAAKGARLGKSYGRIISRTIALFWLLGFPVGTFLGIWVFTKTASSSWNDGTPYTPGFADQTPQ
jgi:ABC-type transport system involved in cytochrome bd biosynthesis fused ATPase/permease subunit